MTTIALSVLLGMAISWYVTMTCYSSRVRRAENAVERAHTLEIQARMIERDLQLIAALRVP